MGQRQLSDFVSLVKCLLGIGMEKKTGVPVHLDLRSEPVFE